MSDDAKATAARAADRLHHLSLLYSDALVELVAEHAVGLLPRNHPGLAQAQARDLIDLILFARAEINGLTKLLIEAKVITAKQYTQEMAEQYEWFAQQKAHQLGVGLTDAGIVFSSAPDNN